MKFSLSIIAVAAFVCAPDVSGFAAVPSCPKASSTSLSMIKDDGYRKAAASFVAAAFLMSNVAAPAFAMDETDFGSSQVIAARSGGRAGGRSSRAPSHSHSSSSRTIIRNTYVQPPVYHSPSVIVAPPVYNPYPGLGFSLGLNAMNQIGNDLRDYRQESEIRDTRSELVRSQAREADLEARLRQLEMMQQQGQLTQQQQQQVMQQQQLLQQQLQQQPAN